MRNILLTLAATPYKNLEETLLKVMTTKVYPPKMSITV